ncbi:MAG: hemerythrin domain-containing protein [Proteobacteria bacterium]|nr:hemerythrin domain-containing protein [Pseudomonadota bacterium]MCP4917282.1 hemerythrin domain-containing protein [Pseudomonadota bacterium]
MSNGLPGPARFFTHDHRKCDELWVEVEGADDLAQAATLFKTFDERMRRHLHMEEDVLFPELEKAAGFPPNAGPTAMMRSEHDQMRALLVAMRAAVEAEDLDELLDQGDTLLMLIQQHNSKEEQILYPMADNLLAARWTELCVELDQA